MAEEVVKRSSMMGAAELEDIIDAAYACSMMSLQALKEDGYQSSLNIVLQVLDND